MAIVERQYYPATKIAKWAGHDQSRVSKQHDHARLWISKQHTFINIGGQTNEERGRACGCCREGKDMPLIADVVLAMVLIEDVLKLLLMMLIKTPAREVLALQVLLLLLKATPRWNASSLVVSSNTVLAAKCGPTATITKWAMTLGHQQGTIPCRTPKTRQYNK